MTETKMWSRSSCSPYRSLSCLPDASKWQNDVVIATYCLQKETTNQFTQVSDTWCSVVLWQCSNLYRH